MTDRELLVRELAAARRRSLMLLEPLDEADLVRQHSPIMSPLVWDLAHVGNYEELWLLREVAGAAPMHPEIDDLYDAFQHPRRERPTLPLLGPAEAHRYIGMVRDRVLDVLDTAPLDGQNPLVRDGFVYAMVVQHEHQHDETMLATLQLMERGYLPVAASPPAPSTTASNATRRERTEVLIPAGAFEMGTDDAEWALDNERPAHRVDLPAYWIDRYPVTNAEYAEFLAAVPGAEPPMGWARDGAGGWLRTRFGHVEEVPPAEPVQHVSWDEASAYARWAGKRLPTEAEWEKAAAWDPAAGRSRRYPWGDEPPTPRHANLDGTHFRPADIGAYPDGASAYGVEQLLGDVWEWTSSPFGGYPGFRSFPYREYSEVFFGPEYLVLRGGSWATSPLAIRTTFRNWDYPIRRQIFAGFRCARDADEG